MMMSRNLPEGFAQSGRLQDRRHAEALNLKLTCIALAEISASSAFATSGSRACCHSCMQHAAGNLSLDKALFICLARARIGDPFTHPRMQLARRSIMTGPAVVGQSA